MYEHSAIIFCFINADSSMHYREKLDPPKAMPCGTLSIYHEKLHTRPNLEVVLKCDNYQSPRKESCTSIKPKNL